MAEFYDNDDFSTQNLGNFKDESEKKLYEELRKNPNLDYDPEEDEMTEEQFFAMIERKKRIEERRQAGRDKRAREEAMRKAKAEGKRRIPAATKPVQKKTTDKKTVERSAVASNAAEDSVERKASSAEEKSVSSKKTSTLSRREERELRKNKRGRRIFYLCLAGWALLLLILGFVFLRYTDRCLHRYENSRYEKAIDGIVKDFADKTKDGSILDMVELPEHACVFESEDLYRTTYLKMLQASDTFSYEKDKNSYDAEHPIYDIFGSDGNLVAKIKLQAYNEKTIFAILRIGEWKIESITPSFNVTTNSYRISVPDTYRVTVNDITVTEEFLKGTPVPIDASGLSNNADVRKYVTIPSMVTYDISGLAEKPNIVIYNGRGEQVEYTPDANGNIKIETKIGEKVAEMPQDRHDFALETQQMWTDFLTRDLPGANYGLSTIQKRLIKDSGYYNQAYQYAHDIDITFISDHRDDKPKYTNVSVDEYTEYSDECYSCRIRFTKNMILNKTGGKRTVEIDTVNYYLYVDDTPDDGVINPHWCVADMITTTNGTFNDPED